MSLGLPAESNDLLYCEGKEGLLRASESAGSFFEEDGVVSLGEGSPLGVHGTDGLERCELIDPLS